jgi:Uma2 family endonuclease
MSTPPLKPIGGEPFGERVWERAYRVPGQDCGTEEEYLGLDTNHLVEYADGRIEILPMPTLDHQLIMLFLRDALVAYLAGAGRRGTVIVAPYKVRLGPGRFREPDVVLVLAEHAAGMGQQFTTVADLVIEIVSESNPEHDWETKRLEYAQAGIPEYWIVDPQRGRIAVLTLAGTGYVEHGTFVPGQTASSVLLPGFTVEVAAALHPKP